MKGQDNYQVHSAISSSIIDLLHKTLELYFLLETTTMTILDKGRKTVETHKQKQTDLTNMNFQN